ncbi:AI-2E family transporter [Dellaglioa sp. BT-FLS60]
MKIWQSFIENIKLRRFVVLCIIMGIIFLAKSVISIVLLTFIFTYLVVRLINVIQKHLPINSRLIVIAVYLAILALLYLAVTKYLPILFTQTAAMTRYVFAFYHNPGKDTNVMMEWIVNYLGKSQIVPQLKSGFTLVFKYVTSVGFMAATFLLSLILSFFYTIEKDQMSHFLKNFLTSDFGWFFQDVYYFGEKFVKSFGVVIEAQFFIATVNTVITVTGLYFMKIPQLLPLGILIFLLSLIPVAGVLVSCIPLSLVGYSVGGIRDVVYILIMLMVVHLLESYVLNPKFMSSRTELPIFFTFVILLVSEELFGTWGLIVGIPIFTFFLDILGVKAIPGTKRRGIKIKGIRKGKQTNGKEK